jgi:uncharacterized BrkB/YihY/UPF0761 family membrane protein
MTPLSKRSTRSSSSSVARSAVPLLLLSVTVFASAFALRNAFFSDIEPISRDYAPPQNGALEAAFLLLAIENAAAIVSVIAIVIAALAWWKGAPSSKITRER